MINITVGTKIKDGEGQIYILDNLIDSGGFGDVYKAHREVDDSVFAIKILHISFDNQECLMSFQKETVQIEHVVSDHVIKYIYAHDGNTYIEYPPYIIMEYADGGTLYDLINHQIKLGVQFDNAFILDIYMQLAKGMRDINKALIHRDIKPKNILMKNDVWKISDFGLSKLSDASTCTLSFKGYGTAKYTAPEAWSNDKNTIQMDIYSMGIVFYELATLQYPYPIPNTTDALSYRNLHLYNIAKSPANINEKLQANMISVIIRMLEKSTKKRFSDWDTIMSALNFQPLQSDTLTDTIKNALINRNKTDLLLQERESKQAREHEKNTNIANWSFHNLTILFFNLFASLLFNSILSILVSINLN